MKLLWKSYLDLRGDLLLRAIRQLKDRHLAEDTVQETAKAVGRFLEDKARPEITNIKHARGFVFAVHRCVMMDELRRHHRLRRQRIELLSENKEEDPASMSPQSELSDQVKRALSVLKLDDRLAILSRFFYGHTLRETADLLGVSTSTAQYRLKVIIEKLRRAVGSNSAEE